MQPEGGRISIWFFIGALVFIYGILILGAGIYDLFAKSVQTVVLADLHSGIWWGLLMLILGGIYTYKFYPRKERS
jgi:hypothetical protein